MSFEEYDAIDAMNWSTLKHMADSPMMLQHRKTQARQDTPALRLGRYIHCATLEPERWERDYVAQPDFGDGRTKKAKAAKAAWLEELQPGVTVVDAKEHFTARMCAEAIRNHPKAAAMLSAGVPERTITWKDRETGVLCKARLDFGAPGYVLDIKSSRQTSLRAIAADFARYRYHGQMAWYHDGARTAGVIPKDAPLPRVIVVQTVAPFDVVPGWIGEEALEKGRDLYRQLLHEYLSCKAAQWWPGMAPEPVEIPIPHWAEGGHVAADEGGMW